jgi:hypothetical protein
VDVVEKVPKVTLAGAKLEGKQALSGVTLLAALPVVAMLATSPDQPKERKNADQATALKKKSDQRGAGLVDRVTAFARLPALALVVVLAGLLGYGSLHSSEVGNTRTIGEALSTQHQLAALLANVDANESPMIANETLLGVWQKAKAGTEAQARGRKLPQDDRDSDNDPQPAPGDAQSTKAERAKDSVHGADTQTTDRVHDADAR